MRSPNSELNALRDAHLHRELRFLDSPNRRTVSTGGRELLNFSSNDYLGLAGHPRLLDAARAALEQFGTGAAASRLIYGGSSPHRKLESAAAAHFAKEGALTFANGYCAATGVIPAIVGKGDTVILDKRCHASLIDGARLSGATVRVIPHNGLEKLERLLAVKTDAGRVLVITESVFSMDGDSSPLAEIVRLKQQYGALLLLDEAHAFGVLGAGGRGLAHEEQLADQVDFLMATFGKSAGAAGGCVAASAAWIALIANRARSFIYSTAPPPSQAASALAGLQLIASEEGDELRERLRANVSKLAAALDLPAPDSAILPFILGDEQSALSAADSLRDSGHLVPAIRYPTVSLGSARLRISLSAAHREEDIESLATAIRDLR